MEDVNDPIAEALAKLGANDETEIDCKLYRFIGSGGRQTKEYIQTYSYAPEVEEIAVEHGGGYYQMKISYDGKTAAANVRIASRSAAAVNVAAPVVPVNDMFMEFERFMAMGKMFREMFQPSGAAVPLAGMDLTPLIMENATQTNRALFEMQKEHARQIQEIREYYEAQEEEEEEDMENDIEDDALDLDSILPLVVEYLPQLLGPTGKMLVPIVKGIPVFQKIRNSIPIARKILDGLTISDGEKIQLIKMLNLPAELIP